MKAEGVNIEGGGCWAQGTGAALAKARGRGLDWGWIVVLLRVFFFRELLFYCAVARLQCRDGGSQPHDGGCLSGSLPVLAGGGGPCVTSGDVV
jgi:hypothetical protein